MPFLVRDAYSLQRSSNDSESSEHQHSAVPDREIIMLRQIDLYQEGISSTATRQLSRPPLANSSCLYRNRNSKKEDKGDLIHLRKNMLKSNAFYRWRLTKQKTCRSFCFIIVVFESLCIVKAHFLPRPLKG